MHGKIIKDLTAKKGITVFTLMQHFAQQAGKCGYFFDGPEAQQLASIGIYERRPSEGLHVPVWKLNYARALTPATFIRLITAPDKYNAKILGYADNGHNQAVSVSRPPVYLLCAAPHITVSWVNTGNPSASGYMQFSAEPPQGVPSVMHGTMKAMLRNGKDMDLGIFRSQIKALEIQRMNEISEALDPKVKDDIDKHFDTMTWEEIKNRFIVNGFEFNESIAQLYMKYRVDLTEQEQREELEADAEHDRQTDEEWEKESRETCD